MLSLDTESFQNLFVRRLRLTSIGADSSEGSFDTSGGSAASLTTFFGAAVRVPKLPSVFRPPPRPPPPPPPPPPPRVLLLPPPRPPPLFEELPDRPLKPPRPPPRSAAAVTARGRGRRRPERRAIISVECCSEEIDELLVQRKKKSSKVKAKGETIKKNATLQFATRFLECRLPGRVVCSRRKTG